MKIYKVLALAGLVSLLVILWLLWPRSKTIPLDVVQPVNPAFFFEENLVEPVKKEIRTLSDGTEAECYVLTFKKVLLEHEIGPWAPTHVRDGKEKGGIWFKEGKVYDIDGQFIAHLNELYDDSEWDMVREDGSIKVTETREAFELAARPNVDPRYHNHVVECPPEVDEWKSDHAVYVIPVKPVYRSISTRLGHGPAGLAFNGVNFDPPAPIHAIIGAHTIAPFDHSGGHVNPHVGYHYHAATGHTKEVEQPDNHAPMIGYALDGFGIYAQMDKNGMKSTDLDECSGHYDEVRGYHYHVSAPAENQIIGAFRGIPGSLRIKKVEVPRISESSAVDDQNGQTE